MATSRERRIAKELQDIHLDKDSSGVFATPLNENNLLHLKGTFPAPPDTPYAGGTYQVDITIPDSYPFKSPTIRFETKIWHPNISSQTVSAYPYPDLSPAFIFIPRWMACLRPRALYSGWKPC
jgi:ubiquitin-conjugating enzyme (huntingtin interacting protein 2)